MRRQRIRLSVTSPFTAALAGGLVLTPLAAVAAPAPQAPSPQAPAPTPADGSIAIPSARSSITVDGVQRRVLAQLSGTSRDFTMAGITFTKASGQLSFQVRARTAQGWQPWQKLEYQSEAVSGAEQAERRGTDPTFFGEATEVEARVLTSPTAPGSITGARLSLIDSRTRSADATLASSKPAGTMRIAASTGASKPWMVSRAGWGADESMLRINGSSCVPANLDSTVKAAIVHHTAGTNSYTAAQSASIVRGIYAYHTRSLGWCDVGYNFLVDKYGTVFEGRHGGTEKPVHGAHATDWNTNTVGISVMMNSSTAKQSQVAMDSVARVLAWKLAGNYRDPNAKFTLAGKYISRIARHGDVMQTACPGTNITAYMPALRSQVTSLMGNWKTPIYAEWVAQGGESGKLGSPHILERPWNGGRTTTFTKGGIYQTTGGATYWMNSAISNRYLASDGFTKLGWPVADQTAVSGTQNQVRFAKGTIWSSAATGTRITAGAIDSWIRNNPSRFASLGLPTGEAVASSSTSGYQSFSNGTLRYSGSSVTVEVKHSGRRGDLNGDRRADVVSVDANGVLTWRPTQTDFSSGTPATGTTLNGQPFSWLSSTDDLNGDGQPDLIATRSDGTLWSWRGLGNGQFTGMTRIGHGWTGMRQINVVPDMTGDKLPEILAIRKADQSLYRYSLSSSLAVKQTRQIGWNWGKIVHMTSVGDLRRTGVVDILAVTTDGRLLDYYGSRSGTIVGSRQMGHGWLGFTQVRSIGDVTGDAHWDLVANRATGPLLMYTNRINSWGSPVAMVPEVSGLGTIA